MNDAVAAIALGRRIDLTREADFVIGGAFAIETIPRRALSPQPIEIFAPTFMDDPIHIGLFLDGIALAEAARRRGAPVPG